MSSKRALRALGAGIALLVGGVPLAAAPPSLTPPTAAPNAVNPAELRRRIDAYLRPFVDDGHLSGTVLVARGPDVVYQHSFGKANYELAVPVEAQTRFAVASVTKPVTALIAAQLIGEKKLAASDPIEKWIPGFPSGPSMTVDHLLTHRAGIPHRVTSPAEEVVSQTAGTMVELARRQKLLFEPGARSSYSSTGYSVLARVLEVASGMTYAQLVAERVARPAGLTATIDASVRTLIRARASGYLAAPEGPRPAPLQDLSFLVGAGSLYTTPGDLFRLLFAVREGALGAAARQWLEARPRLAWNGNTNGFRAFVESDPATGLTVVVASNLMTGALDRMQAELPRLAAGETVPVPTRLSIRAVSLGPDALARIAGEYRFGPDTTFPVTVAEGGTLEARGRVLVPISPTSLFSYADYGTIQVVVGADGQVERLDWKLPGGRVLPMPRVAPSP